MKNETNCTSLEKVILNKIESILENLPEKGTHIDLNYILNECKKVEACSSIV